MNNHRRPMILGTTILVVLCAVVAGYALRDQIGGRLAPFGVAGQPPAAASPSVTPVTTPEDEAPKPRPTAGRADGSSGKLAVPALANRLGGAASPYLRAAAGEPVFWQPFDEQAFRLAEALDRPILLDVGGTWCHWCRAMSKDSYSDPAIAALINDNFVAVKVDADERPDLDRRFQQAMQVVAQEAGWPLTLLLTPKGEVLTGATYLAAQAIGGRPSLESALTRVAAIYREQPEEVDARGSEVAQKLTVLRDAGIVSGDPRAELVGELAQSLLASFDAENGGFGQRAKSPAPQAVELALQQYREHGDQQYLNVAAETLDAMAAGGIHDQLGGAFHRYTIDPRWAQPHFEIVGALNGALMLNYLHAYEVTGDARYRAVAQGIVDYLNRTLADSARGGFYSSQDADVSAEDDGGYYTWTAREIKGALPQDEAAVVLRYYGVAEPTPGIKPDDGVPPGRSVLRVAKTVEEVAGELGLPIDQARAELESGREHLRAARGGRPAPGVDRSFFVDRNAMLASAYFGASRIMGRTDLRDFARRTVDRLLSLPRQDGLLAHSYTADAAGAPGLLDDQMATGAALLDAYEETHEQRYLNEAGALLDRTIAVFGDQQHGGFFDVAAAPGPGAIASRQRPYDDGPTLGGNPLAAITLDRYAAATGRPEYRAQAEATLRAFAGAAREYGPFASGYALALSYHLSPP